MPYRITSTVTAPATSSSSGVTRWGTIGAGSSSAVTDTHPYETFDYRDTGRFKDGLKYSSEGFAKGNATGIEATLSKLRDRYALPSKSDGNRYLARGC